MWNGWLVSCEEAKVKTDCQLEAVLCSNSGFTGRQIWIQIQALGKFGIDKPHGFLFLISEREMVMLIVISCKD